LKEAHIWQVGMHLKEFSLDIHKKALQLFIKFFQSFLCLVMQRVFHLLDYHL